MFQLLSLERMDEIEEWNGRMRNYSPEAQDAAAQVKQAMQEGESVEENQAKVPAAKRRKCYRIEGIPGAVCTYTQKIVFFGNSLQANTIYHQLGLRKLFTGRILFSSKTQWYVHICFGTF